MTLRWIVFEKQAFPYMLDVLQETGKARLGPYSEKILPGTMFKASDNFSRFLRSFVVLDS